MEIAVASEPHDLSLVIRGKQLLAEAKSLDDIRLIRDQAEAIRGYLKKRREGLRAQNEAAEIVILANLRIGERSKAINQRPHTSKSTEEISTMETPSKNVVLANAGIKPGAAYRCESLVDLGEDVVLQYMEETKAAEKELTMAGVLKLAKRAAAQSPVEQPDDLKGTGIVGSLQELIDRGEQFKTIYADPPWRYGNQATRAATDDHYVTMTVDEICAEPVSQLAEDNAHLHLWTTNAFLRDAFNVMEAWGFTYKSAFIWVKPQMGIGNYWRVSHEYLLFGIRGKSPFLARDEMSWGQFDRGAHSAKPDEIRQKIEKVSPGPYLEMYGRESPLLSAWTVYGNQVERSLL